MNASNSGPLPRRWVMLGVLSLSLLLIELDSTIVNVALPTLQREFATGGSALQWLVDSYVLVFAGLLLFMGSLADKFGRKRALQAGLALFAVSSVAAAHAGSMEQLIATRVAMGVGAALIMPATLAIIVNVFPKEEQLKAIAVWSGAAVLGVPAGPILGGWLLSQFWWGSVFYVAVPVALVALVAGVPLVPESKDPDRAPLDRMGAALSIGMLGSLVYGIIEAPDRGLLDARVLGSLVAALALTVAFIFHELRTPKPLLDVRLFKDRALAGGYAAITVTFGAMVGTIFLLTQYFQFARGDSPLMAGMRIAPLALGFVAGAVLADNLARRLGMRWLMSGGLLLVAAAYALVSYLVGGTAYPPLAAGLFWIGFAMAFVMTPATAAVMGAVPGRNVGVGSALNDTGRQVGAALGIAVLGSLTKQSYASQLSLSASVPADLAQPARDSIGRAAALADVAGEPVGDMLRTAASSAFFDAFGIAMVAVAIIVALTGAVVWHVMPAGEASTQEAAPGAALDGVATE